jgi:polyisoprenoid-binding protein YceI
MPGRFLGTTLATADDRAAAMNPPLSKQGLRESRAVHAFRDLRVAALARIVAMGGLTILLCLVFTSQAPLARGSGERAIDTERSVVTVRVYKAGLFSSFGHDHEIRAPIKEGAFDEEKSTVQFVLDARTLRVVDHEVSDKDRAEIQATMLGPKVLNSEEFREIRFRSTEVNRPSNDRWIVRGDLTLHGQTRPVEAEVERQNRGYRGSVRLRQKAFGITPISVAGGSVKVKDEVRVEFEIVGK